MSKTFNWGIIGLGKIAAKFAEDLKLVNGARLHAVASRSEDRSREFAGRFGVPNYYGSYEGIVTCPDLDAVYIATPHASHAENTLLCLRNRIPVLCEKPFAMNTREVETMIAAAREFDTFLMEALWTRFIPSTQKVLSMIAEGTIGKVLSVKADFGFKAKMDPAWRLYNRDLGGGSLLDIGIYPAFLATLLLGNPSEIKAIADIGETMVDEECGAVLLYEGGQMAHIHSTIKADTKTEAFIYGEKGNIYMHTRWHHTDSISLHLNGERPVDYRFEIKGKGYGYEAEEVMSCIAAGKKESAALPLQFSLDLIRLLDQIRREAGISYPQDET